MYLHKHRQLVEIDYASEHEVSSAAQRKLAKRACANDVQRRGIYPRDFLRGSIDSWFHHSIILFVKVYMFYMK